MQYFICSICFSNLHVIRLIDIYKLNIGTSQPWIGWQIFIGQPLIKTCIKCTFCFVMSYVFKY
jgi:hypothetical protein